MLCPTPAHLLVDESNRPYFLWDEDLTLDELRLQLAGPRRAYWMGKVLRQAKPDDALQLVSPEEVAGAWPEIVRYLGTSRPFWSWLLHRWGLHVR